MYSSELCQLLFEELKSNYKLKRFQQREEMHGMKLWKIKNQITNEECSILQILWPTSILIIYWNQYISGTKITLIWP